MELGHRRGALKAAGDLILWVIWRMGWEREGHFKQNESLIEKAGIY